VSPRATDPLYQFRIPHSTFRIAMRLRVLFVNPGRHLGGAEQSLLLLLEALRERDVDPTVVVFADGPFAARLVSRNIPVVFLDVPRSVRRASRYRASQSLARTAWLGARSIPGIARLAALIRRGEPDLVHTNGLKAHILGGIAGRLARRPVLWHLRDFPPEGFAGRVLKRAARSLPAVILANSDAVAAAIAPPAGREAPRVRRVYNPVDLDRFHPDRSGARIRATLGLALDAPLVGMVAHLTPWKGHLDFLSIAMQVTSALPTARFLVAGGAIYETGGHSGYAESLTRRTVDLGLGGRVLFLGAREDVPEILAALDVLVHCPTAPEPFGRGVAEAMAVGRPVVAARTGGIPEIVEHDLTGLLVNPGDVRGFTSAVLRLLRDAALRRRLGQAARLRAETLFPVGAHADAVIALYREVT
jgi:glycosyltransferase involved in cell wall biosynthesis